jgi:LmbE family N-acetylglucosaminyl deacetylase
MGVKECRKWAARMGHTVHYCLLTRGDKGVREVPADPGALATMREQEQRGAADVLGVREVEFLDFEDGYLVPDLAARKAVVRAIRRLPARCGGDLRPDLYLWRGEH